MFGALRPNLSGMQLWGGSHCVFRRIWPSKKRCHDDTSKIPCFYTITVEIDTCLVRKRPKLSGMRRWGGSHCAFRRIGTTKMRCHDDNSKIPCFDTITVEIDMFMCAETQAEWDAAVGRLALPFSPNGPSKTRYHDDTS